MPAKESLVHSHGAPLTYPLKRGGDVVIRNGVAYRGSEPVATNGSVVAWLRQFAVLTFDQAYWLPYTIEANGLTVTSSRHVNAGLMPGPTPKHGASIE